MEEIHLRVYVLLGIVSRGFGASDQNLPQGPRMVR